LTATFLSAAWFRPSAEQWRAIALRTRRRAPRPILAAAVFFAIAYVIDQSGKVGSAVESSSVWVLSPDGQNMVQVLAIAAAQGFGSMYGVVAPYLGLLAGFISGSETSAIAMLSRFHMETAQALGKPAQIGLLLAAASAVGGGLASVISPAKLQNAARDHRPHW